MASEPDISLGSTQCKIEDLMPEKLHPVMTELMDNFPHTTYGVNFKISYEVVLEVCMRDEKDLQKYNISVPVMIVPKQDLVMFSNQRAYLTEHEIKMEKLQTCSELELPKPSLDKFLPAKLEPSTYLQYETTLKEPIVLAHQAYLPIKTTQVQY